MRDEAGAPRHPRVEVELLGPGDRPGRDETRDADDGGTGGEGPHQRLQPERVDPDVVVDKGDDGATRGVDPCVAGTGDAGLVEAYVAEPRVVADELGEDVGGGVGGGVVVDHGHVEGRVLEREQLLEAAVDVPGTVPGGDDHGDVLVEQRPRARSCHGLGEVLVGARRLAVDREVVEDLRTQPVQREGQDRVGTLELSG